MKEYFLKLYQYNAWSNDRVLRCLERQQVSDEKILSVMGHVVAAQFQTSTLTVTLINKLKYSKINTEKLILTINTKNKLIPKFNQN